MKEQINRLDFKGQNIYAGIDSFEELVGSIVVGTHYTEEIQSKSGAGSAVQVFDYELSGS